MEPEVEKYLYNKYKFDALSRFEIGLRVLGHPLGTPLGSEGAGFDWMCGDGDVASESKMPSHQMPSNSQVTRCLFCCQASSEVGTLCISCFSQAAQLMQGCLASLRGQRCA